VASYKLKMKEKKIIISNKLGLHARAAAKIVTLTNKFESIIEITNSDKKADAKSIMKILMLINFIACWWRKYFIQRI